MFHPLMTALLFLFFFNTSLFSNIHTIDVNALSMQAKNENKHLLLFFHKDGCGFCEKMQYDTLEESDIEDMLEQYFILVDIGINDEGTVLYRDFNGSKHEYAKSLKISFYPTVGFVDGDNSIVYGAIGYRNSEQFSILLQYIYSGSYKVMEWEDFKNELEFEKEE